MGYKLRNYLKNQSDCTNPEKQKKKNLKITALKENHEMLTSQETLY